MTPEENSEKDNIYQTHAIRRSGVFIFIPLNCNTKHIQFTTPEMLLPGTCHFQTLQNP